MRTITIAAVLIAMMVASASRADYVAAFTRAITAAPTDADPNTSAPASAVIYSLPDWVLAKGSNRIPTSGFLLFMGSDNTVTCTLQPYVRDSSTARWASLPSQSVTTDEGYVNLQVGNADVFVRITSCSGTISAGAPLTLYMGPR